MDTMYETPSDESIEECIINEDVINGFADAQLVYGASKPKKADQKKNKGKTA